eukprot:Nitzschia sp. Nitz4//scaffold42_size132992//4178//5157//NITZ4_003376-RA/size132992-augustus-gene-0.99-mRNA-1//1//CDS//3329551649//8703//frame0
MRTNTVALISVRRMFTFRPLSTRVASSNGVAKASRSLFAQIPPVSSSRWLATAATTPDLQLFQYAICPYCNSAKAVMDYGNIKYEPVEVNPLTKSELNVLTTKEYRKVPIMTVSEGGSSEPLQLNGSDVIVDHVLGLGTLDVDSTSESAVYWNNFAREDLAPLLYPNLCNSLSNSYQAFQYVHNVPNFTTFQKYSIQTIGSVAMYYAAGKVKGKRNITDERAALLDALKVLNDRLEELQEGKQGTVLLSGSTSKPHLGDLTVYGVLRGLEGLAVLDVIWTAYPTISTWYQAVERIVEEVA